MSDRLVGLLACRQKAPIQGKRGANAAPLKQRHPWLPASRVEDPNSRGSHNGVLQAGATVRYAHLMAFQEESVPSCGARFRLFAWVVFSHGMDGLCVGGFCFCC